MTTYLTGFGNHFATEAVAGALPVGRNSPQKAPFGLYAEQLSGTAFTAPRAENRRSWLYRLRPTAAHAPFAPYGGAPLLRSGPFDEVAPSPNRLRWDPQPARDRQGFRRRTDDLRRQRRRRDRGRDRHPPLRCRPLDGRPRLLVVRRRAADRAAARQADDRDRDGRGRGRAPAGRADPTRCAFPCVGRRAFARLCLRELRRAVPPPRPRPDRIERPRQPARLRDAGGVVRGPRRGDAGHPEIPGQALVVRARPQSRSTSSRGTAIWRRAATTSGGSTRSARSATTIPTRRSSPS